MFSREAAAEVERRQLLELEGLRQRQEARMRELARLAQVRRVILVDLLVWKVFNCNTIFFQEEALELILSKQRLEAEDRIRRSLTAEELRQRCVSC
jgi:hypothetical protein